MTATAEVQRSPEGVSAIADNQLEQREREMNDKKLMKWGFGSTAAGFGLMGASVALAPVIPFAVVATMFSLGGLATWGSVFGFWGAGRMWFRRRRHKQ